MENKKLLENLNASQDALCDIQVELEELRMALHILTDEYDTSLQLNLSDLREYVKGKYENEVGKMSFKFLLGHQRVMWLARTAREYCDKALNICELAQIVKGE